MAGISNVRDSGDKCSKKKRETGCRGDDVHRLGLERLQRNPKVTKRRRGDAWYHTLKAYTRKQKIITRSSAEAELYAAALGASGSKGIVSLLRDLECKKNPVLAIDAKTTEYILHRQGTG